jgi:predicted dehydrogenase
MSSKRIRWGLVGGGPDSLIGIVHRVAALMGEDCQLVGGVFSAHRETSERFAVALDLEPERAYADLDALIDGELRHPAEDRMSLVTIATPNYLHFATALKLVRAGFHVVCEKPVTTTAAEAGELASAVGQFGTVFAVAHTYTGYPMVRQLRSMIAQGAIGTVQKVHAQYYQGWLNPVIHEPSQWSSVWRLDPRMGGQSCCMGDIGIHAFNMIEYTTGLKVTQVLADIDTLNAANSLDVDGSAFLRFRQRQQGDFARQPDRNRRGEQFPIGGLWARRRAQMGARAAGAIGVPSRRRTGRDIHCGQFIQCARGARRRQVAARPSGRLHRCHGQYLSRRGAPNSQRRILQAGEFPGIEQGVRGMCFVEAVLRSAADNRWVDIKLTRIVAVSFCKARARIPAQEYPGRPRRHAAASTSPPRLGR